MQKSNISLDKIRQILRSPDSVLHFVGIGYDTSFIEMRASGDGCDNSRNVSSGTTLGGSKGQAFFPELVAQFFAQEFIL